MNGFLEMGRITKIHGLKGMVRATSYLCRETVITAGETLLVKTGSEDIHYQLQYIQAKGTTLLLKFAGVDTPEEAQKLIGAIIKRPREKFGSLEEGEYYWSDLLGLKVVNEAGETLGRIESILPTGSNDVFVCASEKEEILIPGITDVVLEVNLEKKLMLVRLPEVG
jgi:16S rRNA processing protein RimM